MKKRFKLITTIASLCLAVALMAFGVYAATEASFSVTNRVSFDATANVKAQVTLAVDEWTNITGTKPTNENWTKVVRPELANDVAGAEWTILDGTEGGYFTLVPTVYEDGTQMTLVYSVTIENTAKDSDSYPVLQVEITDAPDSENAVKAPHTFEYSAKAGASEYAAEDLAVGKTVNVEIGTENALKITVKLVVDIAATLGNIDLGLDFKLTAIAE